MVVDEIELCTVAEVDGAGKGPRKSDSKAVELHVSIGAHVDDPGVHASTTAVRRRSVKAARASPVAVALAEERSGHLQLRDHNRDRTCVNGRQMIKDAATSRLEYHARG